MTRNRLKKTNLETSSTSLSVWLNFQGKIGSVEIEANENLPITWNQQKDAIMELFQLNNEGITATLASPENMPYIKRAIGLNDYIIPGEDDRQKQYEEIQLLINSEPIEQPPDPMMEQQAMMAGNHLLHL